jgi:hypothetical protein
LKQLQNLLNKPSLRQDLSKKGFERAAAFSWTKSAEEIYHLLLGHQ